MLFIIEFRDYTTYNFIASYEYTSLPPALLTGQRIVLKIHEPDGLPYDYNSINFEVGVPRPIKFSDDTIKITYLGTIIS